MNLLVENGRVYVKGELLERNVLIEDGIIKKITSSRPDADERVNAGNKIILPGLIDPHVHFRDPGLTHKEDFLTGSKAAAAGGFTCVLDMPNNKPPILDSKLLKEKRGIAASKSLVNYGLHFGSSIDNLEEIKKAKNIPSVKIFMNASTGNMLIEDDDKIKEIMKVSVMNAAHAENEKVNKAMELAKSVGKRLYLCHISMEDEISYLRGNSAENVFKEVTPHHLFLTEKNMNSFVVMKPLLKKDTDRKSLWDAIRDGTIDTIGSDHAPHTTEEKKTSKVYGVPGVETSLPLMLDSVNKGRITLSRLVELMCENPAKIFGIKGKGGISKGFIGDLTIIDMKLRKKVRNDSLFTKCGWSPFDGWELKGWPVQTIVNGNLIFDKGEIFGKEKGREMVFFWKH